MLFAHEAQRQDKTVPRIAIGAIHQNDTVKAKSGGPVGLCLQVLAAEHAQILLTHFPFYPHDIIGYSSSIPYMPVGLKFFLYMPVNAWRKGVIL
ncbi:hypothetical protein D3C73_1564450 [compost metagenome]